MSVRDWRDFERMVLKSKGKIKVGDTLNLVDENTAAGFVDVQVDTNPYAFRFRGRKPS